MALISTKIWKLLTSSLLVSKARQCPQHKSRSQYPIGEKCGASFYPGARSHATDISPGTLRLHKRGDGAIHLQPFEPPVTSGSSHCLTKIPRRKPKRTFRKRFTFATKLAKLASFGRRKPYSSRSRPSKNQKSVWRSKTFKQYLKKICWMNLSNLCLIFLT